PVAAVRPANQDHYGDASLARHVLRCAIALCRTTRPLAQRLRKQRQGVPLRPRRGSGHRRNTGVDCALVCGERTLWVSAQDLRGVSRCRRARYRRTLSLHRIPVWDPSANPRLRKMGWRTVRLYPPPEAVAKNRIPCRWSTHPVSLVDTYGRVPRAPRYVSLIDI